jgi:hypothetical protein
MKVKNDKEHFEFQGVPVKSGIVEWSDGSVEIDDYAIMYFENGNCHRENGPAIIRESGKKFWYLNGIWYATEEQWRLAKKK